LGGGPGCGMLASMSAESDFDLRQAAIARVRELSDQFDDIIPVHALREGVVYAGERVWRTDRRASGAGGCRPQGGRRGGGFRYGPVLRVQTRSTR
jgi:hypothetical protein